MLEILHGGRDGRDFNLMQWINKITKITGSFKIKTGNNVHTVQLNWHYKLIDKADQ